MGDPADCVRRLAELAGVRAAEGRVFDWAAIESDLGLRLPADFKLLAESFPDGDFRDFVSVWLPDRWPDGRIRFPAKNAAGDLEAMREYRETGEVVFPYPLFPEPGGVLPWGYLSTAGRAMWLTGPEDPDGWPVVVVEEECGYWDRFDGTACEFLIAVATARYDASGFIQGATIDKQGMRHPMRPIDLSERPVFQRPSPPPPPKPPPLVPPPDFWPQRLREVGWDWRPANELARVRELAGPPPGVRPTDWARVHARLGFALPADYRAFIDIYGPGTFGDIRIAAPGAPDEMELFALLARTYSQVRDLPGRGVWGAPFYPEPGGTVCCGEITSGLTIGWAPVCPDPDLWTVAAFAATAHLGSFSFQADISFTTTLRQHAERRSLAERGLLPPRDPSAGPVIFTPYISD